MLDVGCGAAAMREQLRRKTGMRRFAGPGGEEVQSDDTWRRVIDAWARAQPARQRAALRRVLLSLRDQLASDRSGAAVGGGLQDTLLGLMGLKDLAMARQNMQMAVALGTGASAAGASGAAGGEPFSVLLRALPSGMLCQAIASIAGRKAAGGDELAPVDAMMEGARAILGMCCACAPAPAPEDTAGPAPAPVTPAPTLLLLRAGLLPVLRAFVAFSTLASAGFALDVPMLKRLVAAGPRALLEQTAAAPGDLPSTAAVRQALVRAGAEIASETADGVDADAERDSVEHFAVLDALRRAGENDSLLRVTQ
eukprot:g1456.t1